MLAFVHPWLFLLLLLPLPVLWLWPPRRERQTALLAPFLERLAVILGQQPGAGASVPGRIRLQWLLLILSWALLVTAVARPQWLEEPIVEELPMRDLMLAVDISGSMSATDFTNPQGESIDRLRAVKLVLHDFLARRKGDRVGLILFGSSAFVQIPFTQDLDAAETLLDEAQVGMAGPKTALGDAIGLSLPMFERSEAKERVLILLTDGNDTSSLMPPDRAAEIARDKGVTLYTIGIGNPEAVGEEKFDEAILKEIAKTTGGRYFHAEDAGKLQAIYGELDRLNPKQQKTVSHQPHRDLFHWPLALALLLPLLFHIVMQLREKATLTSWRPILLMSSGMLLLWLLIGGGQRVEGFHLLRSYWLYLMPLAWLISWRLIQRRDAGHRWRDIIDSHLLPHLLLTGEQQRRSWPEAWLALLFTVGIFALAGPTWQQAPSPLLRDAPALMIVFEVTPEMAARDIQPSRLQRAQQKISDLLTLRRGMPHALFAYSGSAHRVLPLTTDGEIVQLMAAELKPEIMPEPGDRPVQALKMASTELARTRQRGNILWITDGVTGAQDAALTRWGEQDRHPLAILAVAAGPEVQPPAGSPPAPPLDHRAMEKLAAALDADLFLVSADDSDAQAIAGFAQIGGMASDESEIGDRWLDAGYWLLPVILLLALLWFRRGWVVRYA